MLNAKNILLAGAALAASAAASARGRLHDRRLEHRAGQRLARGDDLRDQGAGAGLRRGRVAQHRPPQHRRRRPARGHPQPDLAPGSTPSSSTPPIPPASRPRRRGSDRQRHHRRRRRPGGHRALRLHHLQQPGGIRLPRRQVAVRDPRRQGRRRLHARRRRRLGRQRPRQGLQAALAEYPRRQGGAGDLHRLAAGPGQAADPRLHRLGHARSTASGPRASTT